MFGSLLPHHKAVLELAATKASWGIPLPAGRHRGIAVHESFGSFVAEAAEVSVADDGTVRVHRVVCGVDCSAMVTPDTVVAQEVSGTVSADGVEIPITNATLMGDQLRFTLATGALDRRGMMAFNGRITGNTIQGHVEVQDGASTGQYDWTAYRDADSTTVRDHR